MLLQWNRNHETWLKNGGVVPSLPEISLTTLKGRTLPEVPTTITVNECEDFREHSLKIENVCDTDICMIEARVQLPEPVVQTWERHKPRGINVVWQPVRPQAVVSIILEVREDFGHWRPVTVTIFT